MTWGWLLFSFHGRANRAKYWLVGLLFIVLWTIMIGAAIGWVGASFDKSVVEIFTGAILFWTIFAILTLISFWASFAVGVKRLHDRDKSGWWVVVFYVLPSVLGSLQDSAPATGAGMALGFASVALSIWGLVELGFLRGTSGSNRFGPDPLQRFSNEPLR